MTSASFKGFIPSLKDGQKQYGGSSFIEMYPFIRQETDQLKIDIVTVEEFVKLHILEINSRFLEKNRSKARLDSKDVMKNINNPNISGDYINNIIDYITSIFMTTCYRCEESKCALERYSKLLYNDLGVIPENFIKTGVVDGSVKDIQQEKQKDKTDFLLIIIDKKEDNFNQVISFIAASRVPTDKDGDLYGSLICTDEKISIKGLGKILMATTLLLARDCGVRYVYIDSVLGRWGVQASLYSRFGFRFEFPDYVLDTETAMYKQNPGDKSIREKITEGGIIKSLYRGLIMAPMWADAREVDTDCMKNILEKSSWSCRTGGVGEKSDYGEIRMDGILNLSRLPLSVVRMYYMPDRNCKPHDPDCVSPLKKRTPSKKLTPKFSPRKKSLGKKSQKKNKKSPKPKKSSLKKKSR